MNQPVEHVVLFKVKDNTDPSKTESMVKGLKGLSSIEQVIQLTAGPIHREISPPPSSNFTHFFHSRYNTTQDLDIYKDHPTHMKLVNESIYPICEDLMVADWIPNLDLPTPYPPTRSAIRLCLFKLKEGLGESEKGEVLKVIGGLSKDEFGWLVHSFGENFSPFSKGFSIASMAVFPGSNELDGLESKDEFVKQHWEKVGGYLESTIVVDYIVN